MFKIGMKVVCIDSKPRRPDGRCTARWLTNKKPVEGHLYTIRDIGPAWGFPPDVIGVRLEEIVNGIHEASGQEYMYRADRFRPVKTTNIDIFLKMLEPTPEQPCVTSAT